VNGIPTGGGTSNVPVADFVGSPLSGQAPFDVTFTDLSSNAPLSWQWNFGDGNSSNLQSPVHSYAVPGTYAVSLTVTNPAGFDTETKSAYVLVNPPVTGGIDADFTGNPVSGPFPLSVAFTDATIGGTPLTYLWDFGDGQTSTLPSPAHVYASAGVYTVSLTVTDAVGSNTETKVGYVSVAVPTCVVPNVSDGSKKKVQATSELEALGFTVMQNGGNGNWTVRVQSPQGGLVVPCGSIVTIFE
jgi:PKD repeat protein